MPKQVKNIEVTSCGDCIFCNSSCLCILSENKLYVGSQYDFDQTHQSCPLIKQDTLITLKQKEDEG